MHVKKQLKIDSKRRESHVLKYKIKYSEEANQYRTMTEAQADVFHRTVTIKRKHDGNVKKLNEVIPENNNKELNEPTKNVEALDNNQKQFENAYLESLKPTASPNTTANSINRLAKLREANGKLMEFCKEYFQSTFRAEEVRTGFKLRKSN